MNYSYATPNSLMNAGLHQLLSPTLATTALINRFQGKELNWPIPEQDTYSSPSRYGYQDLFYKKLIANKFASWKQSYAALHWFGVFKP